MRPGGRGLRHAAARRLRRSAATPVHLAVFAAAARAVADAPAQVAARARRWRANTGCTSVGESLITRSTSAVAVWRSSACCVSLNSRAFWIAITAWSAKVLMQRDFLVAEGLHRQPRHAEGADARPFQISGTYSSECCPSTSSARAPGPARPAPCCTSGKFSTTRWWAHSRASSRVPAPGKCVQPGDDLGYIGSPGNCGARFTSRWTSPSSPIRPMLT